MVIRQFDVCENPSARSRPVIPDVVSMQSHLLDGLPTVLIAPLVRTQAAKQFTPLILSLPEMAPIDRRSLRAPVGSLGSREDDIRRALGRLFTGF